MKKKLKKLLNKVVLLVLVSVAPSCSATLFCRSLFVVRGERYPGKVLSRSDPHRNPPIYCFGPFDLPPGAPPNHPLPTVPPQWSLFFPPWSQTPVLLWNGIPTGCVQGIRPPSDPVFPLVAGGPLPQVVPPIFPPVPGPIPTGSVWRISLPPLFSSPPPVSFAPFSRCIPVFPPGEALPADPARRMVASIILGQIPSNFAGRVFIPSSVLVLSDYCFFRSALSSISFDEGTKLIEIGEGAFKSSKLQSIVIPSSVMVLPPHCFQWCNCLRSLRFESPSNLQGIGVGAFEKCALETVRIPRSVTLLDRECFSYCQCLSQVVFEEGSCLRRIDLGAFRGTSLMFFPLPPSVERMMASVPPGCRLSKKSLALLNGPRTLPDGALRPCLLSCHTAWDPPRSGFGVLSCGSTTIRFSGRTFLVPASAEILASHAFLYCSVLSCVNFEEGSRLQRIEEYAFRWSGLQVIVIPASVRVLCKRCFSDCNQLMELRFGADSRLVQMGKSVWRGSSLARIVIPKFMEILAPSCFKGSNLQSITFESGSRLWRIGESAFQGSELWYIEIPSSVRAIGASAFAETALMSIIIPQSVEELGAECFSRCKSLKEVILGSWIHLRKVGSTDVSDWHPTTVQRIVKECCCSELTRVIGR